MEQNTSSQERSIPNLLRTEGINYMGYGVLPKYVMHDLSLPLESKAIYAYLSSLAGNGSTAFPSRATITKNLGISKNRYHKYMNILVENGYIKKVQPIDIERGIFKSNVFTLVATPEKFKTEPEDESLSRIYSKICFSGLKSAGYGIIPRALMSDNRIDIEAKGIYAYFCTYAGETGSAFPLLKNLRYHLGMGEDAYYKHFNQLRACDYIQVKRRRIKGIYNVNDYYLIDMPNPEITEKLSYPENRDSESIPSTNRDTGNIATNSTNVTIPSITNPNGKYNQSIKTGTQAKDKPEKSLAAEGLRNKNTGETIYEEILRTKRIPHYAMKNREIMEEAIRSTTGWDYRDTVKSGTIFEHSAYNVFVEALADMCTSPIKMKLCNNIVSRDTVLHKLNSYLSVYDGRGGFTPCVSLDHIMEAVVADYRKSSDEREIRSPLQYMKACIWNVLKIGEMTKIFEACREARSFLDQSVALSINRSF